MKKVREHKTGKDDKVQPRQHCWQSLVIADEATEAGTPGEIALNYPPAWKQHEAALGLGQLDYLEVDAVLRGVGCRLVPGVARVHIGQRDPLTGHFLQLGGRASPSARPCSLAGVTNNVSRLPSVSTARCNFELLRCLCPSYPARLPLSGVDCNVLLSRIAAVGWPWRRAVSRTRTRRSSTRVS